MASGENEFDTPALASEGQIVENDLSPKNDFTFYKNKWSGSLQCHRQMVGQTDGSLPANGSFYKY